MNIEENERLLNVNQVRFLLSCSRSYLDKLIRQGKLKPMMDGNRLKFSYNEVNEYIERLKRERERITNAGATFINLQLM